MWSDLVDKILSFPLPGSAWFLPVLFELSVFLAIIIHLEKISGKYSAWVFPVLFLLFLAILPLTPLYSIKLTYQIIYFAPFIMAGYYINSYKDLIRNVDIIKKKALVCIHGFSLLLILFLMRFIPAVNSLIYSLSLITAFYNFIVASSGILFSILLIKLLTGKLTGRIPMFMAICGIYSLELYLIHLIVLNYLGFYSISLWPGPDMLGAFIGTMAILLVTLSLSILLSYNKWISLFFFGRWSFPYVFKSKTIGEIKMFH